MEAFKKLILFNNNTTTTIVCEFKICNTDDCTCELKLSNLCFYKCNYIKFDEIFSMCETIYFGTFLNIDNRLKCIVNVLLSFILTRYQNRIGFINYIINDFSNLILTKSQEIYVDFLKIYIDYLQFRIKLADYKNWETLSHDLMVKLLIPEFYNNVKIFQIKNQSFDANSSDHIAKYLAIIKEEFNIYSCIFSSKDNSDNSKELKIFKRVALVYFKYI